MRYFMIRSLLMTTVLTLSSVAAANETTTLVEMKSAAVQCARGSADVQAEKTRALQSGFQLTSDDSVLLGYTDTTTGKFFEVLNVAVYSRGYNGYYLSRQVLSRVRLVQGDDMRYTRCDSVKLASLSN